MVTPEAGEQYLQVVLSQLLAPPETIRKGKPSQEVRLRRQNRDNFFTEGVRILDQYGEEQQVDPKAYTKLLRVTRPLVQYQFGVEIVPIEVARYKEGYSDSYYRDVVTVAAALLQERRMLYSVLQVHDTFRDGQDRIRERDARNHLNVRASDAQVAGGLGMLYFIERQLQQARGEQPRP